MNNNIKFNIVPEPKRGRGITHLKTGQCHVQLLNATGGMHTKHTRLMLDLLGQSYAIFPDHDPI